MPEIQLRRIDDILTVRFGEHEISLPFADIARNGVTWHRIYNDAVAYGRELFEQTFSNESVRAALTSLPDNERLILVADDPLASAIPWEYLRDTNNKLLSSRLNFVRSVPESERRDNYKLSDPLEILAIPVSPVDNPDQLNTEREWQGLVEVFTRSATSLTLTRVRPPTLTRLKQMLDNKGTTIVHFMGHSTTINGKGFLVFEDTHFRSHLLNAFDFIDALNEHVFFVILNSCHSAVVTPIELGNIAQACVRAGVPYALGMQFMLPDEVAPVLSKQLYDFLLQKENVEAAVRCTRQALEQDKNKGPWAAGIPVLYTNLREPPISIELRAGQPTIRPNPEKLDDVCNLLALPTLDYFFGREREISEALDALREHQTQSFVVLHGLGGIGKTALARAIAERISWQYDDRVLAVSFETFSNLSAYANEQFADRFYNLLADFYEIDPTHHITTASLQRAILQQCIHARSLLVLDGVETLIDAYTQSNATAEKLFTFIGHLMKGDGAIILTSRSVPPKEWGQCKIVSISGLSEEAGGKLFLSLLPAKRRPAALPHWHQELSRRVKGHPLSIRLLAGRFAESTVDLGTFLSLIEEELMGAEQAVPAGLEDTDRQATLYACISYSIRRLTAHQLKLLHTVSVFKAPFMPEFVVDIVNERKHATAKFFRIVAGNNKKKKRKNHLPESRSVRTMFSRQNTIAPLESLVQLGLLERKVRTFGEGELILLEMHSIVRWYIEYHLPSLDLKTLERYGWVYKFLALQLAVEMREQYYQSPLIRTLIRQSLPDFESSMEYIPSSDKGMHAFYLPTFYERLGLYRRALTLYEQALGFFQNQGKLHNAAVVQVQMGKLMMYLGHPLQEVLVLYQQSLSIFQSLGEKRSIVATQHAIADLLMVLGRHQESLALFNQTLRAEQDLGDMGDEAASLFSMALLMLQQENLQEAMTLLEKALHKKLDKGSVHNAAAIQLTIAEVLVKQGNLQESLGLLEQVLRIAQEIDDVLLAASALHLIAHIFVEQGHLEEALQFYEKALQIKQGMGSKLDVAATQQAMVKILVELGRLHEALALYEQILQAKRVLGDVDGALKVQSSIADLLETIGLPQRASAYYEEVLLGLKNLGNLHNAAITQANFSQLLFRQREPHRAMAMAWQAYKCLIEMHSFDDALDVQEILVSAKKRKTGSTLFNAIWKQVIAEPQPDWLNDEPASTIVDPGWLSDEELDTIVSNFVSIMTGRDGELNVWRETMFRVIQQMQEAGRPREAEFFAAIIALFDGRETSLPKEHPYTNALDSIKAGLAYAGQPLSVSNSTAFTDEALETFQALINTRDLDDIRQLIEARWELLRQPEIEKLLEELINTARIGGDQRAVEHFEPYLIILRECKVKGIAGAFKMIEADQREGLPFDPDILLRSITAYFGSPEDKLAEMEYLRSQAAQTTDEGLKDLIHEIPRDAQRAANW